TGHCDQIFRNRFLDSYSPCLSHSRISVGASEPVNVSFVSSDISLLLEVFRGRRFAASGSHHSLWHSGRPFAANPVSPSSSPIHLPGVGTPFGRPVVTELVEHATNTICGPARVLAKSPLHPVVW